MNTMNYSALGVCHCGKTFPATVGPGRRRKHCSDKCREGMRAQRAARAPAKYVRLGCRHFDCAHCGESFSSDHKRKYCSTKCMAVARVDAIRVARQAKSKKKELIRCKVCEAVFCQLPSTPGRMLYCTPCAATRTDNTYSIARKARLKLVTVEDVDRLVVFERDKWLCQMCGIKTVAEPYTDRSAELDHIIPLSQGGLHSYLNTQCSCRKCNGSKGAKARGQMLMFG